MSSTQCVRHTDLNQSLLYLLQELHEKLVRLLEMNERPPEPVEDDVSGEQIEGIHFRLVYSGRKLFWRSQQSVDLEFYLHDRVYCIEVAGVEASTSLELSRLYLDYNILLSIVSDIIGRRSTDDSEEVCHRHHSR